jgi:TolB-like protein
MTALEAGRWLGHYEILAKIGEGGMGEVYRARDTKLGRDVALKVLPSEVATDTMRCTRFEHEARAVAALNHPNIITLHSIEQADDIRFLTMELVLGETLSSLIGRSVRGSRGPALTGRQFVDLAIPIVDAIAAAHAHGITHRDLKPQNILVTRDGRPKVLDFGLAKLSIMEGERGRAEEATQVRTAAGVIVGTVTYMSPEQALGLDVDARSDLFSLGVVFYEMLSGRRPFEGNTATQTIDRILHADPEPIDAGGDATQAEIARIVAKCLQKERERRYQSAADLRADLENLRAGSAAVAIGDVARSDSRRRRTLVAAGLAATVITASALLFTFRPEPAPAAVPRAAAAPKTVAVLPFRNLSADVQNAYFADGVHEDVMTKLSGIRNLKVISRTSVIRFRTHEGSLRDVGRRLDARYVVEGSVRRDANQVRVTASLVDTQTDRTLWSATYDRELVSVLALQSAIAQEIATKLEMEIGPGDRRRLDAVPTVVISAYDDYLRARKIFNESRWDYEQLESAIGHLTSATKADPNFAEGWALLAQAYSERVKMLRALDGRETDARSAASEAEGALTRARALAPDGVATLRAAAWFYEVVESNTVDALRNLDAALKQVPDDSETLLMQGAIYLRLGRIDDVVTNLEKAYAVDNANGLLIYGLTFAYQVSRQYAKMPPFFERLLALEPEKTHYGVQAKYFQFLSDGRLESFRALEEAVRTVSKTDRCDLRSVQNNEMVVALVNRDFDRYAKNWEGKWERHQRGHGNWACPQVLNEEANHAALLLSYGRKDLAATVIEKARREAAKPYTERSGICIFDRAAFRPKLEFMHGGREKARREFDQAVMGIFRNEEFPRGAVERAVLLETADMVAPDRVFSLYREIVSDPLSLIGLEAICANPWTFPNLLADPRFIAEVRKDGRFVQFLETYGIIPRG